jgi:hypothetical protein
MDEPEDATAQPEPAVVKRRWAILRGAGGGVAVIAVAGALALADPSDPADNGERPGGGATTESPAGS